VLELREITKKFSVFPVVDNVSFCIKPGEILGYLGPNGAGKSTTIKMLTGLLEPTSGEILFRGKKVNHDWIGFKKKIGYVPEEPDIYPHMSAYDYLLMVGRLRQIPEKTLEGKIEQFGAIQFIVRNAVAHFLLFERNGPKSSSRRCPPS
jgi:ABC-2 type transport system ATP-binding protein